MITQQSFLAPTYLKIMARSFKRNKVYTTLNLLGLAVGFTVFIMALSYIYFETHFESFHKNSQRIYRATYQYAPQDDYQTHWARVPFDYINELPNEIQGIETLVRFQNHARKYVRIEDEKFKPAHAYMADNDVFRVFDFKLVSGNTKDALSKPGSVVISESLAAKYFGKEDPMNKEVYVISDLDTAETVHRVTGILKDLPTHTHLPVEMLISFRDEKERTGWAYTYVMLENGTSVAEIQSQMPSFIRKHSTEEEAKYDAIIFQPLSDIHLQSDLAREIVPNGNAFYVKIVGIAGVLILLMAVINFANLNTAMALGRAKEISMRKVMGATQKHLIGYLMTESIVHTVLALIIGCGLSFILFPSLTQLMGIQFLPDPGSFGLGLLGVAIVAGMIAGIYPVVLLISLKPITGLKAMKSLTFTGSERSFSFKRVMVTLQFVISILLIASTVIAYNQFRYLHSKNPGMQRDQVLALPGVPDQVTSKFVTFKNRLDASPGINGVTACLEVPSREIRDAGPVLIEGANSDPSQAPVMDIQVVDADFATLLGLKLIGGRNLLPPSITPARPRFTESYTIQKYLADQPREYLINETAMRQLGWHSPEDALGRRISWSIGDMVLAYGPIVGVVQDFHQESLKNKVDPVVMVYEPVWLRTFLVRVDAGNIQESMSSIRNVWNNMFPFYPMEYFFLDEMYNNLYHGELVELKLLFTFSGVAIVIAFIGLVGLVAYALKTRTKEIAVRKVLGARFRNIIYIISREYLIVVLISSAIAIPLSIYGVREWLSEFAYRVDISPASYFITLIFIIFLILTTIAIQSFMGTRQNPAQTLRED